MLASRNILLQPADLTKAADSIRVPGFPLELDRLSGI